MLAVLRQNRDSLFQKHSLMKIFMLFYQHKNIVLHSMTIGAIIFASVLLYLPVLKWLAGKITLEYWYLHLFALMGVLAVVLYRLKKNPVKCFLLPRLVHPGLLIWIIATALYLYSEAHIGIHILSCSLFILYLFGIAGHFISLAIWRSLFIPTLLVILFLPFEQYLDIFLGFPLRLFCAKLAGSLLQAVNGQTLTAGSILMVENRAAIVDLDCSGINGLWIGAIFYLAITWIERHPVRLSWFCIGLIFLGLLVLSNGVRIAALVAVELIIGAPQLAQSVHQSLGLIGFIFSCSCCWLLLFFSSSRINGLPDNRAPAILPAEPVFFPRIIRIFQALPGNSNSFFVEALILAVLIGAIVLYKPLANIQSDSVDYQLQLPPSYNSYQLKLNPRELRFFGTTRGDVQKINFAVQAGDSLLEGSMLLVWSNNWQSHHVPESCYLGQGYAIAEKGVWTMDNRAAVRFLSLTSPDLGDFGKITREQTAIYWFQSGTRQTPDYSSRVLSGVLDPARQWLMISILWNKAVVPADIAPYIAEIQNRIHRIHRIHRIQAEAKKQL